MSRATRVAQVAMVGVLLPLVVATVASFVTNSFDLNRWRWWLLAALVVLVVAQVFLHATSTLSPGTLQGTVEQPEGNTETAAGVPWAVPALDFTPVQRSGILHDLVQLLLRPAGGAVGITTALRGAGGFGKTTLAKLACRDPRLRERYPGGLLWVTVGEGMQGAQLAATINDLCERLGDTRPGLSGPEQAGLRLGELLNRREPTLLVVDDVWTQSQLRPFLAEGVECTRLVTTRVAGLLPVDASSVQVDQMEPAEAETVLLNVAPDLPRRLCEQLVGLTGRWPLLLGLIRGALVRAVRDHRDPVAHARSTAEVLAEGGPSALDPSFADQRDKAVRLTVEASRVLLTDQTQWDRYRELSMIVLELLFGRYPFEPPPEFRADYSRLARLDEQAQRAANEREGDWLSNRFDYDIVARDHLRHLHNIGLEWEWLVDGLLTRVPEHRWGAQQVARWLAGEHPPVHPRSGQAGADNDPSFPFAGMTVRTPRQLADLMRDRWTEAAEMLTSAQVEDLARWAGRFDGWGGVEPGIADKLRRLKDELPVDLAVARAIRLLDRGGEARFRRHHLGGRLRGTNRLCSGLAWLAYQAVQEWEGVPAEAGTTEPCRTVQSLWDSRALRFMTGAELELFVEIDGDWRVLEAVARRALTSVPAVKGLEIPDGRLLAMLLLAAADPLYRQRLEDLCQDPRGLWSRRNREVEWFAALEQAARDRDDYRRDAPAYHVVMLLVAPRLA